jgi:DNA-binding HxlR family transcriptional regulator
MTTAPSMTESRRRLLEQTQGYRITQILYAAASLGIAEALRNGARRSAELAKTVDVPESMLVRLLRALISLDLVTEEPAGEYALTDSGTLLDGRSVGSVRASVLFEGSVLYQHWSDFVDSLRTGQNVYQRRYGMDAWTYRERNPEWGRLFDAAMQEYSAARVAAVIDACEFSGFRTIVDVGGGRGSLLAGILKAYPAAQGILFDQPAVVANAPAVLGAVWSGASV